MEMEDDRAEDVLSMNEKRYACLEVGVDLLIGLCKKGDGEPRCFRVIENEIPDDARIAGMQFPVNLNTGHPDTVRIMLESESFDKVGEGCVVPTLPNPVFESVGL